MSEPKPEEFTEQKLRELKTKLSPRGFRIACNLAESKLMLPVPHYEAARFRDVGPKTILELIEHGVVAPYRNYSKSLRLLTKEEQKFMRGLSMDETHRLLSRVIKIGSEKSVEFAEDVRRFIKEIKTRRIADNV